MNLYNRKNLITAAPEGKPAPSHKSSITQWAYIIIVLLMTAYLLYLLVKPYYVIEVKGLVDVDSRDVVAERDSVLQQLAVSNGQAFKQGDLLATFAPEKRCVVEPDPALEKLSFDMQVLSNDIKALQQEKAALAALPASSAGIQRALEVNASLFRQQQQQQQLQQQELDKLNIKIRKEQQRLALMAKRHSGLLDAQNARPVAEACLAKAVYATEDGQVTDVRVLAQGFAAKGQPILKYRPDNAAVEVVFLADAVLYRSFAQQSQLMVTFPDGTESLGQVAQIQSIASKVGGNLNDLLSRDQVQLRMTLVPADPADSSLWLKYVRLPVTVRGSL